MTLAYPTTKFSLLSTTSAHPKSTLTNCLQTQETHCTTPGTAVSRCTGQMHSDLSGTASSLPHKGSLESWLDSNSPSSCRPPRCLWAGLYIHAFLYFALSRLPAPRGKGSREQATLQWQQPGQLYPSTLAALEPEPYGDAHERSEDSSEELVLSFHLHVDSGG